MGPGLRRDDGAMGRGWGGGGKTRVVLVAVATRTSRATLVSEGGGERRKRRWIPACAGMTEGAGEQGWIPACAGMTEEVGSAMMKLKMLMAMEGCVTCDDGRVG
ncbi:MAG: hypothetical protein D8M59_11520 [Planctomycetes bacterium]|nr:hypothetical protein [Planctomycetota bacterium]